jgi:hypothetical protein
MGHEAIIYGVIAGATRSFGDDFRSLYDLNAKVISSLPCDDNHPWVDRSIFALPGDYPNGTYRRQIMHFGLSIKDNPYDLDKFIVEWLSKFESILKQLYWVSARLHIDRDFGSSEYEWSASEAARAGLLADPPRPITDWHREHRNMGSRKLSGT